MDEELKCDISGVLIMVPVSEVGQRSMTTVDDSVLLELLRARTEGLFSLYQIWTMHERGLALGHPRACLKDLLDIRDGAGRSALFLLAEEGVSQNRDILVLKK